MYFFYWSSLFFLQTRFFYPNKKKNFKKFLIKNKYQRVNLKKNNLKSRSNSILVVFKLDLFTTNLVNLSSLNNLLNLYGVNAQKFCEDLSKDLKYFSIHDFNFSLKIIILKDLTYKYFFYNLKRIFLLKSIFNNVFLTKNNLTLNIRSFLNIAGLRTANMNYVFFRNYYFSDLYLIIRILLIYYFFISYYNLTLNTLLPLVNLNSTFILLSFETLLNNNISLLNSLNINLKHIKLL